MKTRRTFIFGAAGLMVSPSIVNARGQCTPSNYLAVLPGSSISVPRICNAFIDPQILYVADQQNSEWCWAAASAMIFAAYGYRLEQQKVVQRGIGVVANQPGNLAALSNVLNGSWIDDFGRHFRSRATVLFSADLGIGAFSNLQIINQLRNNKPLLYCNLSHAMMLMQVNYMPPENMPRNVVNCLVVDPWPGIGLRSLSSLEMSIPPVSGAQARLLVQIDVMPGS